MNEYLKNLEKIEFVLTYACTGRCKHCSEGERKDARERLDSAFVGESVRRVAELYKIKTVMVFGGEPLLCPQSVYAAMRAARDVGVEHRQVITNGFFTSDEREMEDAVAELALCGVNDLRLSVDAFHAECIPTERVWRFAVLAKSAGIPIKTQPAWLVSREDKNPYNEKTRALLFEFAELGIEESDGNVVFAEGNALKYLGEYFEGAPISENPYIEDPFDVRCLSFDPSGCVLGKNAREIDIAEILESYKPY